MFQKVVIIFVNITNKYIIALSLICWCKYLVPALTRYQAHICTCAYKRTAPNNKAGQTTIFHAGGLSSFRFQIGTIRLCSIQRLHRPHPPIRALSIEATVIVLEIASSPGSPIFFERTREKRGGSLVREITCVTSTVANVYGPGSTRDNDDV